MFLIPLLIKMVKVVWRSCLEPKPINYSAAIATCVTKKGPLMDTGIVPVSGMGSGEQRLRGDQRFLTWPAVATRREGVAGDWTSPSCGQM